MVSTNISNYLQNTNNISALLQQNKMQQAAQLSNIITTVIGNILNGIDSPDGAAVAGPSSQVPEKVGDLEIDTATADNGEKLTEEERSMTKTYFDMKAGSDNAIDAKEFAIHLAAVSRLYDGDTKSTGEEISYKEWLGQQSVITNGNIKSNYDFWNKRMTDMFKEHLGK